MKMKKDPFLKTDLNKNIDDWTKYIINSYWEFENGDFINTPTDLRNKFDISQHHLNKVVKDNSTTTLFLGKCIECNKNIESIETSQSAVKKKIEDNIFLCSDCLNKLNNKLSNYTFSRKREYLKTYVIEKKLWLMLTPTELDILTMISTYDNYFDFFRKVLKPNYNKIYPIIERLNKIALIEREQDNNGNTQYVVLPEIKKILNKNVKVIDDINIKTTNKSTIISDLSLNIPLNYNRRNTSQPHLMTIMSFDKDILIEKDKKYICSVWKNEDGSIDFKLTQLSKLENKNSYNNNKSKPKHISEIISKMYK